MGTVRLDKQITEYLPQLSVKQKEAVLSVVKTFAAAQKDWWDKVSEGQQTAIDKSLAEMKVGKLTAHYEVIRKHKKWVKK